MNAPATPQQIGASVKRKEDYRFLTGAGQYPDDINQPHQTYAVFLRSPHAHARIKSIDTAAAIKAPGVVAICTGADLPATPHHVWQAMQESKAAKVAQ
jgi:carbon-monoxide dehydrogenase large subunit